MAMAVAVTQRLGELMPWPPKWMPVRKPLWEGKMGLAVQVEGCGCCLKSCRTMGGDVCKLASMGYKVQGTLWKAELG